MNRTILLTCLLAVVVAVGSAQALTLKTETFDTAPGDWIETNSRTSGGSVADFGFSNTGITTGNAGEAGGTFARVGEPSSYGTPIGPFTLDDPIEFGGSFRIETPTEVRIGYFQVAEQHACCGTGATGWDFLGVGFDTTTAQMFAYDKVAGRSFVNTVGVSTGETHTFSYIYDPGTSIASLSIDGGQVGTADYTTRRGNGAMFDTFGIAPIGDGVFDGFRVGEQYFDDLTYTVPEPASLGLALGAAGMILVRRKR